MAITQRRSGKFTQEDLATNYVVQENPTTGDLEVGGVPIVITDMVDTWADLQAIPKIAGNDGIAILCKEIGVGIGSVWIYQHSDTKWYPENGSVVVGRFLNVAKVGGATTKELFATINFPASGGVCCFGVNDTLSIIEDFVKVGTNGVYSKGWMVGSTGVVGTDVDLDYIASASNTNTKIGGFAILQRVDDTTIKKLYALGTTTFNGSVATAAATPATVPSINSNGLYVSSAFVLAHASDTVTYEYGEFILRAGT